MATAGPALVGPRARRIRELDEPGRVRDQISQSGAADVAAKGPTAMIFGKPVVGTVIHRIDAPLAGKQIHIEQIFWIMDAGNRIWTLTVERDESGLPADFGTGIEITANDLTTPTTM